MKKQILTSLIPILFLGACTPPNSPDTKTSEIQAVVARFKVQGTVLNIDGKPLGDTLVRLISSDLASASNGFTPPGTDILLTTDEEGQFKAELSLTAKSKVKIIASKMAFKPISMEIEPEENLSLKIQFKEKGMTFGGKVAYTRRQKEVTQVFIMSPDGTGKQFLVNGATADWHPDGKSLAYVGNDGIYTISEDGSDAKKVWEGQQAFFPTWSPDGQSLAFSFGTGDFNFDVHTMKADGKDLKQLTQHAATEVVSDWASKGGILLFSSPAHAPVPKTSGPSPGGTSGFFDGQSDIYSISPEGENQKHISQSGVSDSGARFSPDGSQIAFLRSGILMIMNSDGSNLRQISDLGYSQSTAKVTTSGTVTGAPSWSSDGQYIMATRALKLCECAEGLQSDLYIYGVNNSDLYRATFTGDVFAADWYQ